MSPSAPVFLSALIVAAVCLLPADPAQRIHARSRPRVHPATVPAAAVVVVPLILATNRSSLLLSGCIAGAVALRSVALARQRRARDTRLAVTSTFLGHLVAAIRAGSAMPDACARAVAQLPADIPGDLASDLRRVATLCRGGGNGAVALTSSELEELREVGNVWALSSRLGIPAAELLASARARIDHTVRHRQATKAALAGPRATAAVLSVLPLAGALMGEAMGARPVALLTGGGLGGLLLIAGTVLVSAGFIVSQMIIGRAAG